LNIEYDKLNEIKEKCIEYIDILNNMDDDGAENGNRKLMMFFCDKLNVNFFFT
jgi:hypothetical protein